MKDMKEVMKVQLLQIPNPLQKYSDLQWWAIFDSSLLQIRGQTSKKPDSRQRHSADFCHDSFRTRIILQYHQ